MNINIVCVGRLKEDYWRDACAEYVHMLLTKAKGE